MSVIVLMKHMPLNANGSACKGGLRKHVGSLSILTHIRVLQCGRLCLDIIFQRPHHSSSVLLSGSIKIGLLQNGCEAMCGDFISIPLLL